MANVVVSVEKPISDGNKLKFRTPCDSTTIECLEVKYPAKNGVGTLIKKFVFKDAHGTELSGVGNLFVSGVMIEVLLDVTHSVAYIQNADTNSYIERVKSDIERLEETQKQFLAVAGKTLEDATELVNNIKGVYVGSGDMPDGCDLQIDPNGESVVGAAKLIASKSNFADLASYKAEYSAHQVLLVHVTANNLAEPDGFVEFTVMMVRGCGYIMAGYYGEQIVSMPDGTLKRVWLNLPDVADSHVPNEPSVFADAFATNFTLYGL